ncbi:TPA: AAA family ATPase [Salmonella enterica]|nr:AAA family ATPase [Salmonella enterica]
MAKLITSLSLYSDKMTPGEKRVAKRLEKSLNNNVLIWYDTPIGKKYQHPDFILIIPEKGMVFLEVKDWYLKNIKKIDSQSVELNINDEIKKTINPLAQVRNYAHNAIDLLKKDSRLKQKDGLYEGYLNVAWCYGVIFPNITRKQIKSVFDLKNINNILPEKLTICQDELSESLLNAKIDNLFNITYRPYVTQEKIDAIRQNLFPEIIVSEGGGDNEIKKIMDIQQEILARNIGPGHRVIHGVAGSGKTMILIYRCKCLAEISKKPILILCYNIILANFLKEQFENSSYKEKIQIYHFHKWCSKMTQEYNLTVDKNGLYWENSFNSLEKAIQDGKIRETKYDSVLIDEGHDFDARWLTVIAKLFDNDRHSLLLMFDDAQSIYKRETKLKFSLASVGIQAQGRTTILKINYRNTRQILNFAYDFAKSYFKENQNKELPVIEPETYGNNGPQPIIKRCINQSEEAKIITQWAKEKFTNENDWGTIAILCPSKFCIQELTDEFLKNNIPYAKYFNDFKKNYSSKENKIHIITLQSSKGLEFKYVAVINSSFIYKDSQPESDYIPILYVAFTRAINELIITYYRENKISKHLDEFMLSD